MNYCVYKVTNDINGKYYIGVTNIIKFNSWYYGSGKLIKRAIKKYGVDNFSKIILRKFDMEEDAYEYEKQLVNSNLVEDTSCYNLVEGGSHPPKLFGEKNPNFGKDMSGENNPNFGNPMSQETRQKVSKAWFKSGDPGYWTGKSRGDTTKERISRTLTSKNICPLNARTVLQYDLNGNFIRKWRSANKVKTELGICHVGSVCNGNRQTAGGFIWKHDEK